MMKNYFFQLKLMVDKDICLDLDNTLIYACFNIKDIDNLQLHKPENRILRKRCRIVELVDGMDNIGKGTGHVSTLLIILRPHVDEFLTFAKTYFRKIYIWSAGQHRYVKVIEKILFPHLEFNKYGFSIPYEVFTNEDCIFEKDGTTYKEFIRRNIDLQTTLLIDDRSDCPSKNPKNGIQIPEYAPKITKTEILKDDDALLNLMKWFDSDNVRNSTDVRLLSKNNIFT